MGKHFDTLVEVVRNNIGNDERAYKIENVRQYLESIVSRAKLFEFPFSSFDVRGVAGKEIQEYDSHMNDYLELSRQNRTEVITPFKLTGIEDKESVTIFDKKPYQNSGDTIRIISCTCVNPKLKKYGEAVSIFCADLTIDKTFNDGLMKDGYMKANIAPLYHLDTREGKKAFSFSEMPENVLVSVREGDPSQQIHMNPSKAIAKMVIGNFVSYLGELVYIMDPENFIIQRESNASRKLRERKNGKGSDKLLKTSMRPHYIFLNTEELKKWILEQAKEPWPAHPVRGHWRHLISDFYKSKKGQVISIPQYWTGKAEFDGINGWHYRVMIKKSPTDLAFYRGHEDCKSMPQRKD